MHEKAFASGFGVRGQRMCCSNTLRSSAPAYTERPSCIALLQLASEWTVRPDNISCMPGESAHRRGIGSRTWYRPTSGLSRIYSRSPARLQQETLVAMPKVTNDAGAIRLLHDLDDLGIALQRFVLVSSQLAKRRLNSTCCSGVSERRSLGGRATPDARPQFFVAERLREIDAGYLRRAGARDRFDFVSVRHSIASPNTVRFDITLAVAAHPDVGLFAVPRETFDRTEPRAILRPWPTPRRSAPFDKCRSS